MCVISAVTDITATAASDVAIASFTCSRTPSTSPGVRTRPPPMPRRPARNPAITPSATRIATPSRTARSTGSAVGSTVGSASASEAIADGIADGTAEGAADGIGRRCASRTSVPPLHSTSTAVTTMSHRASTWPATHAPMAAKATPLPPQVAATPVDVALAGVPKRAGEGPGRIAGTVEPTAWIGVAPRNRITGVVMIAPPTPRIAARTPEPNPATRTIAVVHDHSTGTSLARGR